MGMSQCFAHDVPRVRCLLRSARPISPRIASQIRSVSKGECPIRCASIAEVDGTLTPSPQPVMPASVRISTTTAVRAFVQPREFAKGSISG